jgi:hypothetical protein
MLSARRLAAQRSHITELICYVKKNDFTGELRVYIYKLLDSSRVRTSLTYLEKFFNSCSVTIPFEPFRPLYLQNVKDA